MRSLRQSLSSSVVIQDETPLLQHQLLLRYFRRISSCCVTDLSLHATHEARRTIWEGDSGLEMRGERWTLRLLESNWRGEGARAPVQDHSEDSTLRSRFIFIACRCQQILDITVKTEHTYTQWCRILRRNLKFVHVTFNLSLVYQVCFPRTRNKVSLVGAKLHFWITISDYMDRPFPYITIFFSRLVNLNEHHQRSRDKQKVSNPDHNMNDSAQA